MFFDDLLLKVWPDPGSIPGSSTVMDYGKNRLWGSMKTH